MKVVLVSEIEHLQQLETPYNALLEKVGGIESLYYSPDYIRTSLDTFKELGASLFFIAVIAHEELVAVLPFQLVAKRAFGLKSTIRFWGECNIYAHNAHQKILAERYRPEAMDAAVSFLNKDLRNRWDTIEFERTKTDDENIRYFTSRFPCSTTKTRSQQYFYFDADHDLDNHLGPKQLKNIARRKRRLEEDFGPVEFVVKEGIGPEDIGDIKELHTARQEYKKGDHNAFFSKPLESGYVNELITLWNSRKCVRYYSLRLDEKPIAMRVMIHSGQVTLAFVMAFDSRFKKYSPARILAYESFRHEIEYCGTARIETSWGANRLKEDYSSGTFNLHDVKIVNQTVRAQTVHATIDRVIELRQSSRAVDFTINQLRRIMGK
jgi:CelD/BcsL family acetyltransferase involved in cellulose biosynthesis